MNCKLFPTTKTNLKTQRDRGNKKGENLAYNPIHLSQQFFSSFYCCYLVWNKCTHIKLLQEDTYECERERERTLLAYLVSFASTFGHRQRYLLFEFNLYLTIYDKSSYVFCSFLISKKSKDFGRLFLKF